MNMKHLFEASNKKTLKIRFFSLKIRSKQSHENISSASFKHHLFE